MWENILVRRQQFRRFPDIRLPLADYHDPDSKAPDKTYGRNAAVIDDFAFDWAKRRIPKSVFEATDIVHWLALEVALQAMEDAGYELSSLPSERTCVLVGNTLTGEQTRSRALRQRWPYVRRALSAAADSILPAAKADQLIARMEDYYKSPLQTATEDTLAGGLSNTIAGRICNFMNLNGGGYTVDGACASSLIAVANASALVASGEMDVAFAGGVDVSLDAFEMIGFAKTGALTPGDMTVYDKRGSGFVPGEGCGFVILKRLDEALADGEKIYAVVRGWGISSDGKGGITAPKAEGQALALERAYRRAGYTVQDLDFIEGHGTGTAVGDRIELHGIALAAQKFGEIAPRALGVTSFKSIVGHTKAAAGVGGFIKAVLAVNQRVIPPTARCEKPHAIFGAEARGLYPVMEGSVADRTSTMRAGVSGSGFGGINCHVTIESGPAALPILAPETDERHLLASNQQTEVFLLAAASARELGARCAWLRARSDGMAFAELADLAAETNSSLDHAPYRASVIASSPDDLAEKLDRIIDYLNAHQDVGAFHEISPDVAIGHAPQAPKIGFLYPGQGSQQINMARAIAIRHAWAREIVDATDAVLSRNGFAPISTLMFRPMERAFDTELEQEWFEILKDTRNAQVAICLASVLYTEYLKRLGVEPAAVGGHSLGELSALHVGGAMDLEALVLLAAHRGAAMAQASGGLVGAMAMVACDEAAARTLGAEISGYLVIACLNSSTQTVFSGEETAVDALVALAAKKGISAQRLAVSNAFHSELISGARDALAALSWLPDSAVMIVPVVSAIDGGVLASPIDVRTYCAQQVLEPVRFVDVKRTMAALCDVAVEAGPARALTAFAADAMGGALRTLPIETTPGSDVDMNRVVATLFVLGASIRGGVLYEGRLIRPFVPAADRKFIDNPCERPFSVRPTDGASDPAAADDLGADRLARHFAGIPAPDLDHYLGLRGKFLEKIILADIEYQAIPPLGRLPAHAAAAPTPMTAQAAAPAFNGAAPPAQDEQPSNTIEMLKQLIAERTGFDAGSLTDNLRLLDDLNLDSIKVAEMLAEAARTHGVTEGLDLVQFANATLAEAAAALDDARASAGQAAPLAPGASVSASASSWVRTFGAQLVRRPLARKGEPLSGTVGIYSPDDKFSAGLVKPLKTVGFDVKRCAFAEAAQLVGDPAIAHLMVLLEPDDHQPAQSDPNIAALQLSAKQPVRDGGSICYVLRGDIPGAQAFAASLHLERPSIKVRVIEAPANAGLMWIAETVRDELATDEPFAAAIYNKVRQRLLREWSVENSVAYTPRHLNWDSSDLILVTGGAKGITAECALAVAQQYGTRVALVGSSAHTAEKPDAMIANTLARYTDLGVGARYYSCDISKLDAVSRVVDSIESEMGAISGVIHGAGLNLPRRAETVDLQSALAEIAPKLSGVRNLMSVLGDRPLKAFAALTSIIGVTGMAGNAWYAYSNEAVDALLEDYRRKRPQAAVFTIAYSVWDEVGMGARMGSTAHLARLGIAAIPLREGVNRFMQMWNGAVDACPKVVAARLGGLDTWIAADAGAALKLRFIDEIKTLQPGVELEARAHLDAKRDLYLRDHHYKGSLLFPTVFGMEAMTQAAARVLGSTEHFTPGKMITFSEIALSRPIVVHPEKGAWIELRAEVAEIAEDGQAVVHVVIRTEATGWSADHFAAQLTLGGADMGADTRERDDTAPLSLDPKIDLYGPLLFQGPRFQRLQTVRRLEEEREYEGRSIIDIRGAAAEANQAYSFAGGDRLLLGDPFVRDAVLQSGQLLIPQHLCLPIAIDKAFVRIADGADPLQLETQLHGRAEKDVTATCTLRAADGRVVHRLEGYRVRILESKPGNPAVADLAQLDAWQNARLAEALAAAFKSTGAHPVATKLAHVSGMHGMDRDTRHVHEGRIVKTLCKETGYGGAPPLTWHDSGKPVLEGSEKHVSISHDDASCLVALADLPVGCDLAPVTVRTRDEWLALLDPHGRPPFTALIDAGEDLNMAGTRVWAAREALIKAGDAQAAGLRLSSRAADVVLLTAGDRLVLTLRAPSCGRERIVAVTTRYVSAKTAAQVSPEPSSIAPPTDDSGLYGPASATSWITRDHGQVLQFHHRFNLLMDDVNSVSRTVSASRYFAWMGKVRELALQPVMARMAEVIGTGDWGAVTNNSEVRVHAEAHASDRIIGTVQAVRLPDSDETTIDLRFDWSKEDPNGHIAPAATSLMRTSWVKIVGHGLVEKHPLPAFLRDFLRRVGEFYANSVELPATGIAALERGGELANYTRQFGAERYLYSQMFATDQEDSNLVGNIYHSNYGKWQSRMFDRFLFQLEPGYFRQGGRNGEWLTQRSRLDYLRDAMPFDAIETEMRLRELTSNAVKLAFSYFRRDANGCRTKLAHGEQDAVWVRRTAGGGFLSEPMPTVWRSAFLDSEHEPARAGHTGRDAERDFSMHVVS